MKAWPAWAAVAAVMVLIGGAFAALVSIGLPTSAVFDAWFWQVLRFTLWQTVLSTVLSVALAVPVARALSRWSKFPGRGALLALFGLPLAIPAIVAVFAILAVYGGRGWVNGVAAWLGLPDMLSIYGLDGILVAHVFFNLPLAVRLLLASLERVPLEHWRVAQQLSLSPWMTFRVLEWPAMRNVIGGVAGLVFMLCLTSFAVVLILGGGPAATTLDVAIYQALRFDFDPQRAVALGVLQLAITAGALAILSLTGLRLREEPTASAVRTRPKSRGIVDAVLIAVATVFVASPILALAVRGLGADLARLAGDGAVLSAAATSIGVAFAAGLLGVATALALAHGRARAQYGRGVFAAAGSLTLVVSPVLLGAGWFVALNRFGGGLGLALPLLICANAALALPFAMRILDPAFASTAVRTDKLVAQLGLTDSARLRVVWWPMMRRPILSALAFAAALSLGDLGVIALIGSQDLTTLPALLMQRLGSYRTDDAAGLALILALLAGSIFALGDRGRSRL